MRVGSTQLWESGWRFPLGSGTSALAHHEAVERLPQSDVDQLP
jgi:hypothetical protein